MEVRIDLAHLGQDIAEVKGRIKQAFYADLFLMMSIVITTETLMKILKSFGEGTGSSTEESRRLLTIQLSPPFSSHPLSESYWILLKKLSFTRELDSANTKQRRYSNR